MIRRVIKWSKWLSVSLVSVLIVVLLALALLLFTHPGLQLVVWGAQQALPQLRVESAQGALLPRFTLNNVEYVEPQLPLTFVAKSVTLAINPACFTEPGLCVDELALDGVQLSLPEVASSETEQDPQPQQPMALVTSPIPIKVTRLALTNVDLNILGNLITWKRLTTGASFRGNRLRITPTRLDSARVTLAQAESDSPPSQPTPVAEPRQDIILPEFALPLQVELVGLEVNDFTLEQAEPLVVDRLGLVATARGSQINLQRLSLEMPQFDATLASKVTLKGDYPLQLNLEASVKDPVAKGQKVSLSASGSVAKLNLQARLSGLAKAQLDGELQPLKAQLPFNLTVNDVEAQWPLTGEGQYFINVNSLQSHGSLDGYQLKLDSAIQGQALPDIALSLQGQGNLAQIDLSQIEIATLGGDIKGEVMANWQTPLNWMAKLNFSHIQPGLQWPQAEGDISGVVSTQGQLTAQGGWQVALPTLDIDGLLRNYPLNIEGELNAADPEGKGELMLDTSGLVLSHGPNSIEAKGKLGQTWQMDLALNLADLGKTLPDLQGRARGKVILRGKLQQPNIGLDLALNQLDWQQQAQVKQVRVSGNVTPMPEPKGRLNLRLEAARYQDIVVDAVSLEVDGSQLSHELELAVDSNLVSTRLALAGALADTPELNWQGQLRRMTLSSQQGEWRLNQATNLGVDLATQQVTVAAHCWLQAQSSLCLDKEAQVGQSGRAQLSLNQFDFDQIATFVPKETLLKGQVNADIDAKWAANTSPEVEVNLALPTGQVSQQLEEKVTIGWQSAAAKVRLKSDQLDADWQIDFTDNGELSGKIDIANVLAKQKQLDGRVQLSDFNLDFLAPIVGTYSQFGSTINTDLQLSGAVNQPRITGRFVVDDMLLKGEISPVEVDSGRISIALHGYDATLAAAIDTPDGELEMAGTANWQQLDNWQTQLRIYAEELLVELPPMVKIKVQPDMTISASPTLARVDGDISLPWGRIVIEDLPPSAVAVSKDQVLLDKNYQPLEKESQVPFSLETNVNINIGDDFKLSAFGLQSGLSGKLNVAQKDKGPFVTGEVNIIDGSYRSFGQDLQIKEGKILMNGPVDQPYVQITAIRNPNNTRDDVTAGVKVTGPASEPTVTIFSEPAMPQANALSYLLRGQDIDGEAGGSAMTTTLIGLSLAKSGRVVGEIGEAFGVQDLQLDTAGSGNDSQVTVSGYILPGLQVKYGVGIFDSVGEFTVRYRLMQDLYLEAISGVDSAVDVLYQFEFD
ncbi:autotransporter assembly complex protein TamB [Vibrio sinaloensis]|uniref:autotransporter assembly complex protein TamB n=1 Tax=Photobacterium sp. (strain ATCC 43367) TaxID=379097 RepID=UPI0020675F6F|nr:translocation/assembly module TamB domain-containing protein [Vibrio sinaloensis]UPQ88271.1 translocation/assembly module TamB [Vibrio sinaloensis]